MALKFHLILPTSSSSCSSSGAGFPLFFAAFFAVTIALCSLVHLSSQEGSFSSLASPRCSSICRRNEESLCKRCLFREPMRFGKRASNFREPMRFGKKSASAPVLADSAAALFDEQLAKRDLREPMRFGKKSSNSNFIAPSSMLSLHEINSPEMNGNFIGKRAEFREPMRFGKRFDGTEGAATGKVAPIGGGEVVGPVMSEEGTMSLESPWIGSLIATDQPVFGSLLISGSEENSNSD